MANMKIWWRIAAVGGGQPGAAQAIDAPKRPNGTWFEITGTPADTLIEWSAVSATGPWTALRTKPAVAEDPSRIPQIRTSPGGRPNVTPAKHYLNRAAEMMNPDAHPMPGMSEITHRQVKSGRWSDPAIWDKGTKPGNGDSVWGASGMKLILDEQSDAILNWVGGSIGWTFEVDTTKETRLRFCTFMNMGVTNIWDEGVSSTPGTPKHEFVLHPVVAPGASAKLGVMPMGPVRMIGAPIQANYRMGTLAGQTLPGAPKGATVLHIPGFAAGGGAAGHRLVVGATEFTPVAATDPQYTGPTSFYNKSGGITPPSMPFDQFQFSQNEERTVTEVMAGDMVRIDKALIYDHLGAVETIPSLGGAGEVITIAPCVSNLTRSILFRAATAEEDGHLDANADITVLQKRPHFMAMATDDVSFRHIGIKNFGRSSTDPSFKTPAPDYVYQVDMSGGPVWAWPLLNKAPVEGDPTTGVPLIDPLNVNGKWAFHLHWNGGPYLASRMVDVVGLAVYAPIDAVPIPGWAMTQHGTRASFEDCVVSNFRGAGFVTELGLEIGQWVKCYAYGGRGDGTINKLNDRAEVYTGHNGHAGVAFEMQSRALILRDCVGIGCHYVALWHAQKSIRWTRQYRGVDVRMLDGFVGSEPPSADGQYEYEDVQPATVQIPPTLGVEGHASSHGISVIHRQGEIRKYDMTPGLFDRCHMLNVPRPVQVPQYSSEYFFSHCLWIGPLNMMHNSVAVNTGTVAQGFSFSFNHMKNYRTGFGSVSGLNWKGVFVECTFDNVKTPWNDPIGNITEQLAKDLGLWGVMGPWRPTGVANQFYLRTYEPVPLAALPLNYPLPIVPADPTKTTLGTTYPKGYSAIAVGDVPVFVPDARNKTVLTLNGARDQGSIRGVWIDCAGPTDLPGFYSPESFPNGYRARFGDRKLKGIRPEQVIQRNGCWLDGAVWKTRTHLFYADRVTHVRAVSYIDWTITTPTGAGLDFLKAHQLAGPPPLAKWSDELEAIPAHPPALKPVVRDLRFLSNLKLDVVSGRTLSHSIEFNASVVSVEIVGGANAADFELASMGRVLRWKNNGSRASGTYTVTIRVSDWWGNSVEGTHEVLVQPASSNLLLSEVIDTFERADGPLETDPAWVKLLGPAGGLSILNKTVIANNGSSGFAKTVYSRGSLGSSDMEVRFFMISDQSRAGIVFRMVDENNYLMLGRDQGSYYLQTCIAGVSTTIANFPSFWGTMRLRVRGRRFELFLPAAISHVAYPYGSSKITTIENDELSAPGVCLLPEDAPMGTQVGICGGPWKTPTWFETFEARRLTPLGDVVPEGGIGSAGMVM
ncbi:hypothetical protein [Falsirhodobacter sp. 20TX0035]|uniref:hypothetical protein n=1 Tax=Falsirhodobacter sp. 20TX0035 TaxID=3022019 RepID=UPI00232C6F06|nr:hypothetical protein [Falsirhodobacter sp. 20TX0035]MDB6455137.1 hypothetical protein [Falsirhodobacter sp. 20TX0035]